MRLFEAILEANHRALAGDARAGVRASEFGAALPIAVLTCYDPRMHPLMPEVLGVAEPDFLWLTNAGNVITSPLSSTVRSLALACAIHDAKEIAIIGHTDCRFFQPGRYLLAERVRQYGVEADGAVAPLGAFLGSLVDEAANVRLAAQSLRASPLIRPTLPVHGLLVDIESGRLEWLVNGYLPTWSSVWPPPPPPPVISLSLGPLPSLQPPAGPVRQPDFKVGLDLPPIGQEPPA